MSASERDPQAAAGAIVHETSFGYVLDCCGAMGPVVPPHAPRCERAMVLAMWARDGEQ